MRPVKSTAANAAPGIIDTLTAGFDLINRIPWVVGLPILIDVFLWLGPRVSAGPVIHDVVTQLGRVYDSVAANGVDPQTVDTARKALTAFDEAGASFNLLSLLVVNLAGVPSIVPAPLTGGLTLAIGSGVGLLGIVVGAELVGILMGCLYFGAIAQQIRDGRVTAVHLGRRVWFYWLSVIGFIGLAIGLCLLVSIPVGLAIGLAVVVSPGVGTSLGVIAFGAMQFAVAMLFLFYLFFLVDAIVVSEAGPVRAAINSVRVVTHNFGSTLRFIGLIYVISWGMQVIWTALSKSPAGTMLAIAGNSYIESGLAAASMLYYQSRVSRLPAARGVFGRVTQT